MEEPKALLEAMDAAAIELLNSAKRKNSVPADGEGRHAPSITESVKVFEAVGRYLEWRTKGGPAPPEPPKDKSKFERLREEFNGGAEDSGRGAGRSARKARGGRAAPSPDA